MHHWLSSAWSLVQEAQTLLTFVVGLAAGTYLSRRTEKLRQLETLRSSAYADFIRGVAGLATTQRGATVSLGDEVKFRSLVADAQARIAIYGSRTVAACLARFLRGGAVLDTDERAEAFCTVCSKMREDSRVGAEELAQDDMSTLLFGPKDETASHE
jgi:hypothetical protein